MNKTMIVNPEPGQMPLTSVVDAVDAGKITIPKFQRKFVWSPVDVASLFDSIFKGYPIGTFTLWQTKERLCPIKEVGGHKLPEPKKGETAEYVLDGQQRLTSIYACLKAITVGKYDYSKIYVRLTNLNEEDDQLVVTEVGGLNSSDYITIRELIDLDIEGIYDRYKKKSARSQINEFHKRLLSYQLPVIRLTDVNLAKATEIFTRINTTGKSLTLFEIISAKVYDPDRKFDLLDKRKEQRDKWMSANYGTISDSTVLEAISICVKQSCKRGEMLKLTVADFADNWDKIDDAFGLAIEYLQSQYGIPSAKLLPYEVLIIPFVYYFFKSGKKRIAAGLAKHLSNYFWRSALTTRFTEGAVSKITQDVAIIDDIIAGNEPKGLPAIDISINAIKRDGEWNFASAYAKAILCLLSANKPRRFDDGGEIKMDGKWLAHSNSVNYHHFFPKAYMEKKQPRVDKDEVDHVVNIAIVDQYLNQKEIRVKAPSEYMKRYAKNKKIKQIMATHLIGDFDRFGIWHNDYDKFFKGRARLLQKAVQDRIIAQKGDVLK